MLHAARCKYRTQNSRQKSPSGHHRTTLTGYILATKARIDNLKKNLLSSNISSRCPHNMVNFGLLAAEIVSLVWGTPANFNGFRILAALLHGTPALGVSQTCGVDQRAPPIFGKAVITLGIGPHSSFHFISIVITRCHTSVVCVCLFVCLSQVGVLLKWLNVGSCKQCHTITQGL